MDEWIPSPDDRVSALAEYKQLGRWRTGAANIEGRFRKQWGEARLHLYEKGLVVTAPGGSEWVYHWESTSVLQHLSTLNGRMRDASYTLIGADGAALTVGRGLPAMLPRQLVEYGGTSHTRGPAVVYEASWGPEIQKGVANAQWPLMTARLRRNETLTFGRVALDRDGVTDGRETVSWSAIGKVRTLDGRVHFDDARGRGLLLISASHILNLHLFLALVDWLRA
ncbi:DUF6585 family protein [Streptomyces sp. NPDC001691]|uniref:DUF6585 family protein n=1 Tax=Streptomyces sp. NPDC001691 TaxID=3364600 RepID=UPI00369AA79B